MLPPGGAPAHFAASTSVTASGVSASFTASTTPRSRMRTAKCLRLADVAAIDLFFGTSNSKGSPLACASATAPRYSSQCGHSDRSRLCSRDRRQRLQISPSAKSLLGSVPPMDFQGWQLATGGREPPELPHGLLFSLDTIRFFDVAAAPACLLTICFAMHKPPLSASSSRRRNSARRVAHLFATALIGCKCQRMWRTRRQRNANVQC